MRTSACNLTQAIADAKGGYDGTSNAAHKVAFYRALLRFGDTSKTAPNGYDPNAGPISSADLETARGSDSWNGWDSIIAAVKCLEAEEAGGPPASLTGKVEYYAERYSERRSNDMAGLGNHPRPPGIRSRFETRETS